MDLFTKENIINYTEYPNEKNYHEYSEEMLKIRTELRKFDQNTKKGGGLFDWDRMLSDFI